MSASSVEAKRAPPLSSNAVFVKLVKLLNTRTVQGIVNRNTGGSIRHFARPYPLWKNESGENREKIQVSLLATCHHRSMHK